MKVKVQRATSDDSSAIFQLANQLHPTMSVARDEFDHTFDRLLSRDESICLVARLELSTIGYISGCLHPVLIQGGSVAYIDEIVIQVELRAQGIGKALVTEFEAWAKSEQCTLVGLATGGAKPFYEQLGFESNAGYFKKKLT